MSSPTVGLCHVANVVPGGRRRSCCFPQIPVPLSPQTQPHSAVVCVFSARFLSPASDRRIHRRPHIRLRLLRVVVFTGESLSADLGSSVSVTEGNRMRGVKQLRGRRRRRERTSDRHHRRNRQDPTTSGYHQPGRVRLRYCVFRVPVDRRVFCCACVCACVWFTVVK